ncbi:MAG: carbamoyltransferase HypF, partial [Victivallales bacterium]|nr:carbamoyltransferase HypF [Victivallales bacterium]
IILLRRRAESTLAPSVAPGNPAVGTMLPYAPVQMLLFRCNDDLDARMPAALVMTSGNVSGAPICRSTEDALREIRSFCDLILSHNRKIRLRADDSVMDTLDGAPYMIRRSRGYAPLPFMLSGSLKGEVLGIGGELKNTFCPGKDGLLYPSPFIGDMADLRSVNALRESVKRLCTLLEIQPKLLACDLHPAYNTTAVAAEMEIPLVKIQHHYAHILSCMAENDRQEAVIGISFDGTGYGEDGTIWGGEILRCDWHGFTRLASVTPFLQPGGDASSREGWRNAASIAAQLFGDEAPLLAENLGICSSGEAKLIRTMGEKRINTVVSTSAGRLFDAAAAVAGICRASTFEGEAAMKLQFAAETFKGEIPGPVPESICDGDRRLLDTGALFRELFRMRTSGAAPEEIAWHFHASLGAMTAAEALSQAKNLGISTVAISGGVMQNTLLMKIVTDILQSEGLQVLRHSMIPPNDGGICLGQAAYAMHQLNNH